MITSLLMTFVLASGARAAVVDDPAAFDIKAALRQMRRAANSIPSVVPPAGLGSYKLDRLLGSYPLASDGAYLRTSETFKAPDGKNVFISANKLKTSQDDGSYDRNDMQHGWYLSFMIDGDQPKWEEVKPPIKSMWAIVNRSMLARETHFTLENHPYKFYIDAKDISKYSDAKNVKEIPLKIEDEANGSRSVFPDGRSKRALDFFEAIGKTGTVLTALGSDYYAVSLRNLKEVSGGKILPADGHSLFVFHDKGAQFDFADITVLPDIEEKMSGSSFQIVRLGGRNVDGKGVVGGANYAFHVVPGPQGLVLEVYSVRP